MTCGMPAAYSIFRKICHVVADSETWPNAAAVARFPRNGDYRQLQTVAPELSEKATLQDLDCKPYESTPHRSLQFAGSLHLATVRWIALICNIQIKVDTREFRDVAIAVARVGLHASLSVSCISGTL
jgi:hypothetical protein